MCHLSAACGRQFYCKLKYGQSEEGKSQNQSKEAHDFEKTAWLVRQIVIHTTEY
jgi:hypothetical protein